MCSASSALVRSVSVKRDAQAVLGGGVEGTSALPIIGTILRVGGGGAMGSIASAWPRVASGSALQLPLQCMLLLPGLPLS